MPNQTGTQDYDPRELPLYYAISPEINSQVFENVAFDKESKALLEKGKEFVNKTGKTQRYAVVGWALKDKFIGEQKKPTLYLRILPGFGPPQPSADEIKEAESFYGENNIVIAKNTAVSGQVHTELIDKAQHEDVVLKEKYKVITGFSFTLLQDHSLLFTNRSMQNFRSFQANDLALACFEFSSNQTIEEYRQDKYTLSYHLTRSIPDSVFTTVADKVCGTFGLYGHVRPDECINISFEKEWQEIMDIKDPDKQKAEISAMIMRNIYINSSLDKKSPLYAASAQRINHLLEISYKYNIPLQLNTIPDNLKAETNGATALMMAVNEGNINAVKVLIEAIKNEVIQNTRTHIDLTKPEYKEDKIQELIKENIKKCFDLKDNDGNTALLTAFHSGHVEIIDLLEEHGATFNINIERALLIALDEKEKEFLDPKKIDDRIKWVFLKAIDLNKMNESPGRDFYLKPLIQLKPELKYEIIGKILAKNPDDNELIAIIKKDFLLHLNLNELDSLRKLKESLPQEIFKTIFNENEEAFKNAFINAERKNDTEYSAWLINQAIEQKGNKYTDDQIKILQTISNIQNDYTMLRKESTFFLADHPILGTKMDDIILKTMYKASVSDIHEFSQLLFKLSDKTIYPEPNFKRLIDQLLLMTVKDNNSQAMELLLHFGADRNIQDEKKQTPVMISIKNKNIVSQKLLLCFSTDESRPLSTLNIDIPKAFYELKPYKMFKIGTVEMQNLYENNASSPQLKSIITILSEVTNDFKVLSTHFGSILKDGMKENKELNIEKTKKEEIEKNLHQFYIEQKNDMKKQIETLKNVIIKEKPSENYKERLVMDYKNILDNAIKNKSSWINVLNEGMEKIVKINNSDLDKSLDIIEKIINDMEKKTSPILKMHSKSLPELKKMVKENKINILNNALKWKSYRENVEINKNQIEALNKKMTEISKLLSQPEHKDEKRMADKNRINANISTTLSDHHSTLFTRNLDSTSNVSNEYAPRTNRAGSK